jgi:hypothetical protein
MTSIFTSLLLTVFLIVLQVCPNLRVETVSSLSLANQGGDVTVTEDSEEQGGTYRCIGAGVTVQRMLVMVLPPNDCFKIRVNFESRYGK